MIRSSPRSGAAAAATSTRSAELARPWRQPGPGAVAVDGLPIAAAVGVWATSPKAMNSTEMV